MGFSINIRFLLFVVLFVSNKCSCWQVCSEMPANKQKADIDTLELVHVMWRHGARVIMPPGYPTDPLKNMTLWEPYADNFEQLTKLGVQMHYELGTHLRNRYAGFLSGVYADTEIFLQSSYITRAIMSGLSNMAGLYPPTPEDARSNWNPDIKWRPVPIFPIPLEQDFIIANGKMACPRIGEVTHEGAWESEYAKAINNDPENIEIFKYVNKHSGLNISGLDTAKDFYDDLLSEKVNGFELPEWTNTVFPDKLKPFMTEFCSRNVLLPTREADKVRSGRLLDYMIHNMEVYLGLIPFNAAKDKKVKMFALSGHEITLTTILGTMADMDCPGQPPFASAVMVELHKGKPDQSPDDKKHHYVRLFFRNSTTEPPHELEIPACGYPCKLTTLKAVFRDVLSNEEEHKIACQLKNAQPKPVQPIHDEPHNEEEHSDEHKKKHGHGGHENRPGNANPATRYRAVPVGK